MKKIILFTVLLSHPILSSGYTFSVSQSPVADYLVSITPFGSHSVAITPFGHHKVEVKEGNCLSTADYSIGITPFSGHSVSVSPFGSITVHINPYLGARHTVCVPSDSSEDEIHEFVAAAIVVYLLDLKED